VPRSITSVYDKNDQLNDPMGGWSEEQFTALGWATAERRSDDSWRSRSASNDFISGLFLGVGIRLVRLKMETGSCGKTT